MTTLHPDIRYIQIRYKRSLLYIFLGYIRFKTVKMGSRTTSKLCTLQTTDYKMLKDIFLKNIYPKIIFICLIVLSRMSNFSAIWQLSPLPVKGLQILTYGFSHWGLFHVPHLLRHGTSVFKLISERPVILTSDCCALDDGAITTYLNVLGLTRPARAELVITTFRML
jgi:hypothetical protein